MLHLVRANSPYTVIILFILTLGLKLQALGHPVVPDPGVDQALFAWVVHVLKGIWGNSATAFTLFAAVLCFGQALYLRYISIKHRLFGKPSYLPAFVYIILSSLHPSMGYFSAALLLNWALLGAFDAILGFTRREDQPRTIYNAGFLLSCAALLHFPATAYAALLLFSLILLRPFRPGEWIVTILGYLTPFYFAICLLYLTNSLPLVRYWPQLSLVWTPRPGDTTWLAGVIGGSLILAGFGIFSLVSMMHRLPVGTRRAWIAMIVAAVLAVPVSMFTVRSEPAGWMAAIPALSLLIAPTMVPEKRSRFATFTFYFLIVLVLFSQLTLRLNLTS